MTVTVPERHLYINGKWVSPIKGGMMPVINPANEQKIGAIPAATPEDVNSCVTEVCAAAKTGAWTKSSGSYRATFIRAIAEKIKENKGMLSKLESLDNGKPLDEAEADMDDVAFVFEYYAGLAEKLDESKESPIDVGNADYEVKVRKEPLGVVALITPWNYPLLMAAWKVAPALAAGCLCILKPSELASVTCLELAAIAHEVRLPAGCLNVITGTGVDAGAPLSSDPRVAKVAFTGSSVTGSRVAMAAAQNLRPAGLELGGKSAIIVFEDADINEAVEWVMTGIFFNSGQVCSATSRLILQNSIEGPFMARLKARAEAIKVDNPFVEGCRLGPVVCKSQYDKILNYINIAKAEGATVVTGGGRPAHLSSGYYIAPTVLSDMKPHMRVWREEVFGPVLSVMTFDSEAEALAIANDSEFGLGGGVISKDLERCRRVAEELECGIVWVNCSQPTFTQAPWGGIKNSGYGRELGEWGLNNFISIKQVTRYASPQIWDWYGASKL